GRPLPAAGGAQLRLDIGLAEARAEVPGAVVGAHMVEAEPVVVLQSIAPLRRPVEPGFGAFRMVAALLRRLLGVGSRCPAMGVGSHGINMEGMAAPGKKSGRRGPVRAEWSPCKGVINRLARRPQSRANWMAASAPRDIHRLLHATRPTG